MPVECEVLPARGDAGLLFRKVRACGVCQRSSRRTRAPRPVEARAVQEHSQQLAIAPELLVRGSRSGEAILGYSPLFPLAAPYDAPGAISSVEASCGNEEVRKRLPRTPHQGCLTHVTRAGTGGTRVWV